MTTGEPEVRVAAEALARTVPTADSTDGLARFRQIVGGLHSVSVRAADTIDTAEALSAVYGVTIEPALPGFEGEGFSVGADDVLTRYLTRRQSCIVPTDRELLLVTGSDPSDLEVQLQEAAARTVHRDLVRLTLSLAVEVDPVATHADDQFWKAGLDLLMLASLVERPIHTQAEILGADLDMDVWQIFQEASIPYSTMIVKAPSTGRAMRLENYFGKTPAGRIGKALKRTIQSEPLSGEASSSLDQQTGLNQPEGDSKASEELQALLDCFFGVVEPPVTLQTLSELNQNVMTERIRVARNQLEAAGGDTQEFTRTAMIAYFADIIRSERAAEHPRLSLVESLLARVEPKGNSLLGIIDASNYVVGYYEQQRGRPFTPVELKPVHIPQAFNDLRKLIQGLGFEDDDTSTIGDIAQAVLGSVYSRRRQKAFEEAS